MSITRLVELLTGTSKATQREQAAMADGEYQTFKQALEARRQEFKDQRAAEDMAEKELANLPTYRLDPRIDGKYQVFKRSTGRTSYMPFGKPMDYGEARQAIKNLSRPPIFLTATGERMNGPEPEPEA